MPPAAASFDPRLSRRRLLTRAAALAGGGVLLGCAPGAGRSAAEISYWHLMTGGDGIVMAGLVDAVNGLNAGFHATQTVLAWDRRTTRSSRWHQPAAVLRTSRSCTGQQAKVDEAAAV